MAICWPIVGKCRPCCMLMINDYIPPPRDLNLRHEFSLNFCALRRRGHTPLQHPPPAKATV